MWWLWLLLIGIYIISNFLAITFGYKLSEYHHKQDLKRSQTARKNSYTGY